MSGSLRLSQADETATRDAARRILAAATRADGLAPLNEQAELDLVAGRRRMLVASADGSAAHGVRDSFAKNGRIVADQATLSGERTGSTAVAVAVVGQGELDLVVDPAARRRGYATAVLSELLPTSPGELSAWSHGDHPAARALAARFGFDAVRTLLSLRLQPLPAQPEPAQLPAQPEPAGSAAAGIRITAFRPGVDDEEWVGLNARIFAAHPEQGGVTLDDLHDRMAEPWFDAGDFLIARAADGIMVGYNWLKIEPGEEVGEIYVIGVDAQRSGHGLGRLLLAGGLRRLGERGCSAAVLYVESDNVPAVHLYRSAGFVDHAADTQYRRRLDERGSPLHTAAVT